MITTMRKIITDVHKKQNFIVSVRTGAQWVKPAQPAKPIFLTPTLLMEGPYLATPASCL